MSRGATPVAAGWYGPTQMVSVTSHKPYSMLLFQFNTLSPGNDCYGRGNLNVPTASENIAETILLTALTTGQSVKIHYQGSDCQVDNVVICADPNNCPNPY